MSLTFYKGLSLHGSSIVNGLLDVLMNSAALLYILFEEHMFSEEKDSPCINATATPINIMHELSGTQNWSLIFFSLF